MQKFNVGKLSLGGLAAATLLLAGCTTTFTNDSIDYKSAGEKKIPNLAYPPDLTAPPSEKRYSVADGKATLSNYNANAPKANQEPTKQAMTLVQAGMRIEKSGDRRWLVVKKSSAELYPKIKEFWEQTGFLLVTDSPKTGIMETDWAENRAKIPQDFIRRTLGKVLDSIYSTGERDKFRTRVEQNAAGETEVYISHRGAIEQLVGSNKDSTMWTGRPSDPELEAEMLSRLMVFLGSGSLDEAKKAVGETKKSPEKAVSRVQASGAQSSLSLDQSFDRAWREVGLGLDRSNFTVEDRDRAQGVYFVRFVNPKDLEQEKKEGFFANLFKSSSKDEDLKRAKRYRVLVRAGSNPNASAVLVQDGEGKPASADAVLQILNLLDQQVSK